MKREYKSPEFELFALRLDSIMDQEVIVSKPQIPDDDYNPGELN